jgi:hypothetical protein
MMGKFALDATTGGASGSGTYEYGAGGYGPGTWRCARLPIAARAPLTIVPTGPTLTVGEMVNLWVKDAAANPIAVTWQSSNTAVSTVSPTPDATSPTPTSVETLTAVATGTATIQVEDPNSGATASTTVTVVDSVDVNPWLGTWTGTLIGPTFLPGGSFDCDTQVTSPTSAWTWTDQYPSVTGNYITFNGPTFPSPRFLVPGTGRTAVSADGSGDTLTLSGSTLTWTYAATGCTSFSGTWTGPP